MKIKHLVGTALASVLALTASACGGSDPQSTGSPNANDTASTSTDSPTETDDTIRVDHTFEIRYIRRLQL